MKNGILTRLVTRISDRGGGKYVHNPIPIDAHGTSLLYEVVIIFHDIYWLAVATCNPGSHLGGKSTCIFRPLVCVKKNMPRLLIIELGERHHSILVCINTDKYMCHYV